MPEPVRVHRHSGLLTAAGDHLHRRGVGADRLDGFSLSSQAQPERADLGLEDPGNDLARRGCDLARASVPTQRTVRGLIPVLSCCDQTDL
jgi:hypothetical protein